MLTMLGAIAEFERTLMLERQKEGVDKAKQSGRYKGRKPIAQEKAPRVRELLQKNPQITKQAIADELAISVASYGRLCGPGGIY